jgi:hypothetical protein
MVVERRGSRLASAKPLSGYVLCARFRTPAMTRPATGSETGVGKAPRHEIAGEWAPSVPPALWGGDAGTNEKPDACCHEARLRKV